MNREKIAEIKAKLKKRGPEILAASSVVVSIAGIVTIAGMVAKTAIRHVDDFEPLEPVDRETQKKLMEDEAFSLYKLTDDEYMFARDLPQD
jgi:cbb3-type cytochrome oxidase cytochrome c subunit